MTADAAVLSLAGLAPLLIGGVTATLRHHLVSKKDFRDRCQLIEARRHEEVAIRLSGLLNHARQIDDNRQLRGDGAETPDLVARYVDGVKQLVTLCHRLARLNLAVKWFTHGMVATIILGIFAAITGWIKPEYVSSVVVVSVCLIVFQVSFIVALYTVGQRLDDYEDL